MTVTRVDPECIALATSLAGVGLLVRQEDVFTAVALRALSRQQPVHTADHTLQTLIHIEPDLFLKQKYQKYQLLQISR